MAKRPVRIFSVLCLMLIAVALARPAAAETRLALVIGNGEYSAGSGYLNNTWQSRFAMRDKAGPSSREATIDFRLARDL